jgi:DUF4097 and DUF4098 domain-containing protein YvlB
MKRHRQILPLLGACALLSVAAGCANGPTVSGSFDRTFTVSGHTRLEINNVSGEVKITTGADDKIHVHADVHTKGGGQQDSQKRLSAIEANPPVEQTPDGVRIGKSGVRFDNTHFDYSIEVPRDTEVASNVASGNQSIRGVRGPVKIQSVSGAIAVADIAGEAQLTSLNGAIAATNIGDAVRASSSSGAIAIAAVKDDVRATSQSGAISISKVAGRVEAQSSSSAIEVDGVTNDVKMRGVSGGLTLHGNPAPNSFWDLHTVSGTVEVGIPTGANFHLLAESTGGEISTNFPIMIEEQGKHSLRAQIGTGGARVEIHTVSGGIRLLPSN